MLGHLELGPTFEDQAGASAGPLGVSRSNVGTAWCAWVTPVLLARWSLGRIPGAGRLPGSGISSAAMKPDAGDSLEVLKRLTGASTLFQIRTSPGCLSGSCSALAKWEVFSFLAILGSF